jgi:catechol 2,3-dioxygenase-like lactoylglutathione lyase family enzyme
MVKNILGVHHVTAIAGDLDPNLDFDTRLLGLRLVKIQYWRERRRAHSTEFEIPQERHGESLIAFRDRCEASDIGLVNCDPYVREWITRQQSGK